MDRSGRMRRAMLAAGAAATVFLLAAASTALAAGVEHPRCAVPPPASDPANVVYVDPVNGSNHGSGGPSDPFKDLNALLDTRQGLLLTNVNAAGRTGLELVPANPGGSIRPGATILLMSGDYGRLEIANVYNDQFLTIRAAPGATPVFRQINISAGRRFVFDGLTLRLADTDRITAPLKETLFNARSGRLGPVSDIVLRNSSLATVADSSRFTDGDWKNLNTDAVNLLDVTCAEVSNNTISNIRRGISNGAEHSSVSGNTITNFSGDGIRFIASHQLYNGNIIRESRNTTLDTDHPDAMQGFAREPGRELRDSTATDIEITRNIIEDPLRPGYDAVQGISYFDGIFRNVLIVNNLVVTNSVHGISAYGGDNVVIAHNTVLSPAAGDTGYTSIKLIPSKTGALPVNAFILNNVTDRIEAAATVTVLGNALLRTKHAKHGFGSLLLSSELGRWFADPANGDFTPRQESPLVNAGDATRARVTSDVAGRERDASPDIGAFEYK